MYEDIREGIASLCRVCYSKGHVSAASGNMSVRTPDGSGVIIKVSGVSFTNITADDFVFVDWDGNVFDCRDMSPSERVPSVETKMHMLLYEMDANVGAVVHLHSPYATAFSFRFEKIQPMVQEASVILKDIPITALHPAGSQELASEVRDVFVKHGTPAVVLRGHGTVTIGKDIQEAYNIADTLEHNAMVTILTRFLSL